MVHFALEKPSPSLSSCRELGGEVCPSPFFKAHEKLWYSRSSSLYLLSKASSATNLEHFTCLVLLNLCFKFLIWGLWIGEALLMVSGGALSRKATESQYHHMLFKVRQKSCMLAYKMLAANSKHPPFDFQHMLSNRLDVMVLPVWPRRWWLRSQRAAWNHCLL